MRGFIDLHCHWVFGIDDGVRTLTESASLLQGLHQIGFDTVVATPHMRPNMFNNVKADLEQAFERTCAGLEGQPGLPNLLLSSEHFFDEVVFARLTQGEGLPYPGDHAVLVEFPSNQFPVRVRERFFDLRRQKLRPVLAHPERYEPVWDDPEILEPLLDGGAVLLMDVAALSGKYGRQPQRTAHTLLERGYYYAACSDSHRPADVEVVNRGIEQLFKLVGADDAMFMLSEGPQAILAGRVEE